MIVHHDRLAGDVHDLRISWRQPHQKTRTPRLMPKKLAMPIMAYATGVHPATSTADDEAKAVGGASETEISPAVRREPPNDTASSRRTASRSSASERARQTDRPTLRAGPLRTPSRPRREPSGRWFRGPQPPRSRRAKPSLPRRRHERSRPPARGRPRGSDHRSIPTRRRPKRTLAPPLSSKASEVLTTSRKRRERTPTCGGWLSRSVLR